MVVKFVMLVLRRMLCCSILTLLKSMTSSAVGAFRVQSERKALKSFTVLLSTEREDDGKKARGNSDYGRILMLAYLMQIDVREKACTVGPEIFECSVDLERAFSNITTENRFFRQYTHVLVCGSSELLSGSQEETWSTSLYHDLLPSSAAVYSCTQGRSSLFTSA